MERPRRFRRIMAQGASWAVNQKPGILTMLNNQKDRHHDDAGLCSSPGFRPFR
jgi:hypothetical protein